MEMDLSALAKAIESLDRAVTRSMAFPEDLEVRDAVIQRFESTYELAWKMLKRRLEADHPSPQAVDQMSFKALLREAAQRGLVRDVERWIVYREARNTTSHTYNEEAASSVHKVAVEFLEEARMLMGELEARNRA